MKRELFLTAAIISCIGGTAMATTNTQVFSTGQYTSNVEADNSILYGKDINVTQHNNGNVVQNIMAGGENNLVQHDAHNSLTVGLSNNNNSANSIVGGFHNTITDATNSIAGGTQNASHSSNTLVVGDTNAIDSESDNSIAGGKNVKLKGKNSLAFGEGAVVNADNVYAIGKDATATANNTIAIGNQAKASNENTIAVGNNVTTGKKGSIGIGSNITNTNGYGIVIGNNSSTNSLGGVVIGDNSKSTLDNGVAIGNGNTAANNSTAVGSNANAIGTTSVAIGSMVTAEGTSSVNIGHYNMGASTNSTVVGSANYIIHNDHLEGPEGDTVIGNGNFAQSSYHVIMMGKDNQIIDSDYAVAIGNGASVAKRESVAIGHNSKANTVIGTPSIAINGETHTFAGGTPVGTVSIGDTGKERTITNVAAGRITADSTDAINGSQLNAVINSLNFPTVVDGKNTTVAETVNINGGKEYQVNLNDNINLTNNGSVTIGDTEIKNGEIVIGDKNDIHTSMTSGQLGVDGPDGATAIMSAAITLENKVDGSTSTVETKGLTAVDANGREVTFTTDGISAGGQTINNVKAGVDGTDAVNVNQLRDSEANIYNTINSTNNAAVARANYYTDLQTAKVGARAAAMANLHYQDFNADDKWSVAAGYGHYKGQNAGALGVAYQPNENTMISVSSTLGSDTMIGAGISMKFGKSSKMNANKQVAMAKEIQELREIVAAQNEKINMLVDHAMGKNEAITDTVFPDVPENHWAYMMVQDLAYKGIVVGYPDGNYNGERTLTRYEFAVALDRAISAGYMNPELGRAIKEFKPELDSIYANMRFRVDRVSGKDSATNKVERVRVNKDNIRDNYGTIVK